MVEIDNSLKHATRLLQRLQENREKLCDVQLKVQDTLIPAHKIILAATSDYFQYKFAGTISYSDSKDTLVEVESGFSVDSIQSIVDYSYSGKLKFTPENALNLFEAASFYQVEFIQAKCHEAIMETTTKENCIRKWCYFDRIEFDSEKVDQFIVANIVHVYRNSDFLCLRADLIFKFFTRILSFVEKKSAEQIYMAMIAWIKYDESRNSLCPELIRLFPAKHLKINAILKRMRDETLIQENFELMKWLFNAKIDSDPLCKCCENKCEDNSESIFILNNNATLYWIFNPNNKHLDGIATPLELTGFSLITINSKIYIIGGKSTNGEYSKVCHIFNTLNDVWSTIEFPYEIENYKACHLAGKIYLLGTKAGKIEAIYFDIETKNLIKLRLPNFSGDAYIYNSDNSIHLMVYNCNPYITIKFETYLLFARDLSWQTSHPFGLNISFEQNSLIAVLMRYYSGKKLMLYYDAIQKNFPGRNMPHTNFRIKPFSSMTMTKSRIYGLANDGIYYLKDAEWENDFQFNFEGAKVTPLEEALN